MIMPQDDHLDYLDNLDRLTLVHEPAPAMRAAHVVAWSAGGRADSAGTTRDWGRMKIGELRTITAASLVLAIPSASKSLKLARFELTELMGARANVIGVGTRPPPAAACAVTRCLGRQDGYRSIAC